MMSKAKKVRNTKEKSDDSDYQLGIDEFTDEDDELIQINTSTGRISKTGKNDETSKDDVDISVQVPMKRIRNHEIDKCCFFLFLIYLILFLSMCTKYFKSLSLSRSYQANTKQFYSFSE